MTKSSGVNKGTTGLEASAEILAMFDLYGPAYRWFAISASMIASFATLLTSTIINVAIPEIMGAFGVTQEKAQWLATGFLASGTVTMLASSWAIERFGMRFVFTSAMLLFVVMTLVSGLAPNIETLIFARTLQGAATGMVAPVSMLVVYQVFPANRRGTAMGIYGIGVMFAPALGPTLGGLMIDAYNWRFVFFLVVPLSLISIPLAMMFLPSRSSVRRPIPFDWIGTILMTTFLITILSGLSDGQKYGWESDYIVLCFSTAFLSGLGFFWWENYTPDPMLDLSLFTNVSFAASALVTFVIGIGLFASTYLLPLFLQVQQHLPALESGYIMLPAGIVMALLFPVAGAISDFTQPRYMIAVGLILFGFSCFVLRDLDANTPHLHLIWWFILGRAGLAMIFPCLNAASLNALPLHQINQGSGAINVLRQLGGAFGVNLVTIFMARRTAMYADEFTVSQSWAPHTMDLFKGVHDLLSSSGLPAVYEQVISGRFLSTMIYNQASTMAFRDGFFLVGILFFISIIPSWFMKSKHQLAISL